MHKPLYLLVISLTIFLAANQTLLYADEYSSSLPENVSIHQLDNGMQVLLIENPGLPMTGVNVVVKVGSAYENFATSGMSHMLEHLLFNGTTTRTQKELYDQTDMIGGYNNANTSDYYTNYMMVTPAEHINKGMELQADMLFNSVLPEEKFAKEKGIVLEEISKSLVNPSEQSERNIISLLYKGHALSLPTLGTYSTIEAMDRDQVYEFYKNNYVPNNMLMSVVGNFDSEEMLKTINEIYGVAAPGEVYRDENSEWSMGFATDYLQSAASGQVFHRFYDGEQLQLQLFIPICYKKPGAFYELLDLALSKKEDDLKSHIESKFKNIVQSIKMQTRQTAIASFIQVSINLNSDKQAKEISTTISDFLTKNSWQLSADVVNTEAAKARTFFLQNIEKPHMFGIYNAHTFAIKGIEGVLASYGTQTYLDAAKDLNDLKSEKQPVIILQHPAVKKDQAQIDEAQQDKLFKSNGKSADIIVRQNPGSQLLAIHYLIKHKAPLEKEFGKDAAKILHDCFAERLDSDANKKISSTYGISLKANDNPFIPMDDRYMHPDYGYIRVEALADDIPAVINFLNAQMLNFKPTEQEFQKVTAKTSMPNPMMMMGGGDKSKKMFNDNYKRLVYEDNPYSGNKSKPDYQQIINFAEKYFIPANMIISVVSPAPSDKIEQLFISFTMDKDAPANPTYNERIRIQLKAQEIEKEGNGKRSYLYWGFSKEIEDSDKAALQALSLILSDKIIFDIREKQGMAYHMSAGIEIKDDRAQFYINQGTRPQNVDILIKQYPDFFKINMLKDLTAADLERSLNMYLGRMMFRHLSSINQGYYLGTSYYFENDMYADEQQLANLKKVTLEDVNRVAQKYLNAENVVSVIVR